MSGNEGAAASSRYAKEWVDKNEDNLRSTNGDLEGRHEQGLATRLYLGCLGIFKFVCHEESPTSSTKATLTAENNGLKAELGRLYLWGEHLSDGSLDKAIDQSEELRCTVLSLLRDLAYELLSCKLFTPC